MEEKMFDILNKFKQEGSMDNGLERAMELISIPTNTDLRELQLSPLRRFIKGCDTDELLLVFLLLHVTHIVVEKQIALEEIKKNPLLLLLKKLIQDMGIDPDEH